MMTSAGILVSSMRFGQIVTSTGCQLKNENASSSTSTSTQRIVRTTCIAFS